MKKVGIFGGSFNPIHTGHIALAKSLCEKAGLDEVWFMVSPQNPFKQAATDLLAPPGVRPAEAGYRYFRSGSIPFSGRSVADGGKGAQRGKPAEGL